MQTVPWLELYNHTSHTDKLKTLTWSHYGPSSSQTMTLRTFFSMKLKTSSCPTVNACWANCCTNSSAILSVSNGSVVVLQPTASSSLILQLTGINHHRQWICITGFMTRWLSVWLVVRAWLKNICGSVGPLSKPKPVVWSLTSPTQTAIPHYFHSYIVLLNIEITRAAKIKTKHNNWQLLLISTYVVFLHHL